MTRTSTYPLRLPVSLKAAVEKLSKEDGTSINQCGDGGGGESCGFADGNVL